MELVIRLTSPEQTRRFGRWLADELHSGDVIALNGPLGAGKTFLVQAVAAGLGITEEEIHSPTYMLIQEYAGRIPVCHLDAYRLRDLDEFLELGADEILGGDCVTFIEWAERVSAVLPRDRLTISLTPLDDNAREAKLTAGGTRSTRLLQRLEEFRQEAG
jgi:tRNA threonylcarbamoyladenosine biosynthesis protein TsaE